MIWVPLYGSQIVGKVKPVLEWFRRSKAPGGLPEYSAVRKIPSRNLPEDLVEKERSEQFSVRREEIEDSLRQTSHRPKEDSSLFVEILDVKEGGVLTITIPEEDDMCVPVFSSPLRAADYVRSQSLPSQSLKYLSSSPSGLVQMLSDLSNSGIQWFALDLCPRCAVFNATGSASVSTAEQAVNCWCISKATELARLELYVCYANWLAVSGHLEVARDVALETVAHVNLEDPRVHFLLGQIAVAFGDRRLVREAKAFLHFLQLGDWEQKLDEVVQSGSPDFTWEPRGHN